ncbi:PEP/pyruvate-binding domain-containing protein, partial [Streptococcus ferus]|uniref:PEP/pyruvate-binding domain-containing protein n=1 Tax=Streptococcus ferus TaxID=1345 RepID=UPI00359FADAC
MELLELHQAKVKASYGGKINGLIHLIQAGFLVPRGLILSAEISLRLLELLRLDASQHLTDSRHRFLLKEMIQSLESFMDEGKSYIVRSSSFLEDGQDSSFAGQYESINGCQTVDQVLQAIEQCLMTAGSHKVKAYQKNQVSSHHVNNLALLIQEEVGADFSGVSFGVDPVSQKDRSWSLEYVQGGGAPLVSGHHQPFAVSSSWDALVDLEGQLLDAALLNRLRADTLLISEIMQCPMDIEFCLVGQDLYYVQARPITRFNPRVSKG